MLWQYSDGVKCRWGRQKSRFSTNIWLRCMLLMLQPPIVIHTAMPNCGKLVKLIAGMQCRLLFAGDGRRSVYSKKPQRYAEDNRTEFSCMPDNKRLRSSYREAWSIFKIFCDIRATCWVCSGVYNVVTLWAWAVIVKLSEWMASGCGIMSLNSKFVKWQQLHWGMGRGLLVMFVSSVPVQCDEPFSSLSNTSVRYSFVSFV